MAKALDEKDILDKMTYSELTSSKSELDYTHLSTIIGELYSNLTLIYSISGGGQFGHIGVCMRPTL